MMTTMTGGEGEVPNNNKLEDVGKDENEQRTNDDETTVQKATTTAAWVLECLQELAGASFSSATKPHRIQRKALKKAMKHKTYASKQEVKQALRLLLQNGAIQKDSKEYILLLNNNNSTDTTNVKKKKKKKKKMTKKHRKQHKRIEDEEVVGTEPEPEPEQPILKTAAAMMLERRRTTVGTKTNDETGGRISTAPTAGADIDDEIARLEQELLLDNTDSDAADDDDDNSNDDESEDDEGSHSETMNDEVGEGIDDDSYRNTSNTVTAAAAATVGEGRNSGVVSLSKYAEDRVESLQAKNLPESLGYKGLGGPKKKRKKSALVGGGDTKTNTNPPRKKKKSGLELAVEEVLGGYTARSSEKLPFYCRYCAQQYPDATTFFQHKMTDFHRTAVELERKHTYCKLCRKQFTSPVQMTEHLQSRPHKEKLRTVRARQQQQQPSPRRGNSLHPGYTSRNNTTNNQNNTSRKQWCWSIPPMLHQSINMSLLRHAPWG